MDEIRELLQNLNQLSAEDLDRLRGLIVAQFDAVDNEPTTPENVALLNELADAGEAVQTEAGARDAAQAQAEADKQSARERIAAINGDSDEEAAEEAEAPEAEESEAPEAESEESAEEAAPEPVTASGVKPGKVARMAARQTKPKASPETAEESGRTALIASAETRFAGKSLDRETLAEAMVDKLTHSDRPMGKPGAQGGRKVIVASANWKNQYPEDRVVKGEIDHDMRIWKQAVNPDFEAIVATGGICAPVNVDYSYNMIATAERPLREALPSFQANRGGLTYRNDIDFASMSGATGIWTEATDANPAGATKPIINVSCPSVSTTYLDAITTRVGWGNMQSRFDPETVAANTDASLAAAARIAENNILNEIAAACTQGVTNTPLLGATRDLSETVGQLVAAFRNLHRVPTTQGLTAIFPAWAKELIRIDLARETAHQQGDQWNSLVISDEQIESLFTNYKVRPVWHLDGQSTSAPGLSGAVNQFFTTQSTGAVNKFPTEVVWYLYYEGAFQLLDGGTLDLGIVRDSLLDSTNDYETFTEIWEKVVFRGFTGGALQLITTLCANGGSAGTISTAGSCP